MVFFCVYLYRISPTKPRTAQMRRVKKRAFHRSDESGESDASGESGESGESEKESAYQFKLNSEAKYINQSS